MTYTRAKHLWHVLIVAALRTNASPLHRKVKNITLNRRRASVRVDLLLASVMSNDIHKHFLDNYSSLRLGRLFTGFESIVILRRFKELR